MLQVCWGLKLFFAFDSNCCSLYYVITLSSRCHHAVITLSSRCHHAVCLNFHNYYLRYNLKLVFGYRIRFLWIRLQVSMDTSSGIYGYVISYLWIRLQVSMDTSSGIYGYVFRYLWIRLQVSMGTSSDIYGYVFLLNAGNVRIDFTLKTFKQNAVK